MPNITYITDCFIVHNDLLLLTQTIVEQVYKRTCWMPKQDLTLFPLARITSLLFSKEFAKSMCLWVQIVLTQWAVCALPKRVVKFSLRGKHVPLKLM
jgi:hypothetical protein